MTDHAVPRVVVITGASAGVGRAAARAFAEAGSDVALVARGRARLEAAADEIRRTGRRAVVAEADVADAQAVEEAAERAERELGPIECWVNNAMTSVFAPVRQISPDEFARVTAVTYLGVVHGSQAALRRMLPRNRGVLVQVSSALAYRGIPLQAAYCAAKHAIVGFTESLRSELIHDGRRIHVTMVHLPAVNTPQFEWELSRLERRPQPVPPIYQPEVAARAILWSSTHRKRELLVGFPTFKTIWGNRLFAGYADRYLARTGYESQQTDEPARADRPANLWRSVPGDYAAHGRFDDRSRGGDRWVELSKRPWLGWVLFATGLLVPALVIAGLVAWLSG